MGEQIGKGRKLKNILSHMNMVAEGVATAKAAYLLSKKYRVSMPITSEVYSVLYKNKGPLKAVNDLMTREKKRRIGLKKNKGQVSIINKIIDNKR